MKDDDHVKELTPGIQTEKEKAKVKQLNSHESQLKSEELFYRALHK